MFHTLAAARLTTAVLCLAVLPLAGRVPALAAMAALAGVLVALNVWEARTVPPTRDYLTSCDLRT